MELIVELLNFDTREGALLELSKKREMYDDLALVLWHSFGELASSFPSGFAYPRPTPSRRQGSALRPC